MIEITTEKELDNALVQRIPQFVFKGPQSIKILRKIEEAERKKRKVRTGGILVGVLAVAAAPFTGGTSLFGLAATAGAVALSETVILAIITAVVTISTTAINAYKEYKIEKLQYGIKFTRK